MLKKLSVWLLCRLCVCYLLKCIEVSVRCYFSPGKLRTGKEYFLERGITPFKVSFPDV